MCLNCRSLFFLHASKANEDLDVLGRFRSLRESILGRSLTSKPVLEACQTQLRSLQKEANKRPPLQKQVSYSGARAKSLAKCSTGSVGHHTFNSTLLLTMEMYHNFEEGNDGEP